MVCFAASFNKSEEQPHPLVTELDEAGYNRTRLHYAAEISFESTKGLLANVTAEDVCLQSARGYTIVQHGKNDTLISRAYNHPITDSIVIVAQYFHSNGTTPEKLQSLDRYRDDDIEDNFDPSVCLNITMRGYEDFAYETLSAQDYIAITGIQDELYVQAEAK